MYSWEKWLDKNFKRFLWISNTGHRDANVHFSKFSHLTSFFLELSKNIRSKVTLGVGSRPLSLVATTSPEVLCSTLTKQSCMTLSPEWKEDFDCAIYQDPGTNNERRTVGCVIEL